MKIRRAHVSDFYEIMDDLSEQSALEKALLPSPALPEQSFLMALRSGQRVITFEHDGCACAAFWMDEHNGEYWSNFIASKAVYRNIIPFVRTARQYLKKLARRKTIKTRLTSPHPRAQKWVETLGFQFGNGQKTGYFNL